MFKHIRSAHVADSISLMGYHDIEPDFDVDCFDLYMIGGRMRGRTLGTVEKYSMKRKTWDRLPSSMISNRGSHGGVHIDGKIYIVGGGGFRSNLASVEVFDVNSSESRWEEATPMKISRHALALVSVISHERDVFVFAIGGTTSGTTGLTNSNWSAPSEDGTNCCAVTERYDVKSDR